MSWTICLPQDMYDTVIYSGDGHFITGSETLYKIDREALYELFEDDWAALLTLEAVMCMCHDSTVLVADENYTGEEDD